MKLTTLSLFFLILCSQCYSQDGVHASFQLNKFRLEGGKDDEVKHEFTIKVTQQKKYKGYHVQFEVDKQKTTINLGNISFPYNSEFIITDKDTISDLKFSLRITRDNLDDKVLVLKMVILDDKGKYVGGPIGEYTSYEIYTKPRTEQLSNSEFWLYTGTNLDLLDGIKPKDLYFKGAYLVDLIKSKNKKIKNLKMYITFGKNRFFSEKDSIQSGDFTDRDVSKIYPEDQVGYVKGYYNSLREIKTENVFSSIDLLAPIDFLSSDESKLYGSVGFYFSVQSIKESFKNKILLTDTTTVPNTSVIFRPPNSDREYKQYNYNTSVGLLHILNTQLINIKTQLNLGYNRFRYPQQVITRGFTSIPIMRTDNTFFTQIRIDATVLKPGISIGFETFLRAGNSPLYNVYLTKVIGFDQLSSLFTSLK